MWNQIFSWAFWGTNETKKCYELNVTHSIWNRTSEHKPRNSLSSSGLSFITLTREVSKPIWRKKLNGAAKGTPNALLFLIVLQKFQQVQSSEKKYKAKSIAEEHNKCMQDLSQWSLVPSPFDQETRTLIIGHLIEREEHRYDKHKKVDQHNNLTFFPSSETPGMSSMYGNLKETNEDE